MCQLNTDIQVYINVVWTHQKPEAVDNIDQEYVKVTRKRCSKTTKKIKNEKTMYISPEDAFLLAISKFQPKT